MTAHVRRVSHAYHTSAVYVTHKLYPMWMPWCWESKTVLQSCCHPSCRSCTASGLNGSYVQKDVNRVSNSRLLSRVSNMHTDQPYPLQERLAHTCSIHTLMSQAEATPGPCSGHTIPAGWQARYGTAFTWAGAAFFVNWWHAPQVAAQEWEQPSMDSPHVTWHFAGSSCASTHLEHLA